MQEQLAGLTARVRAFQCSGEGKRALLEELGTYVYAYPRRKYPQLEEGCGGRVLPVLPRQAGEADYPVLRPRANRSSGTSTRC